MIDRTMPHWESLGYDLDDRESAKKAFSINGNLIRKTPQYHCDREMATIALTANGNAYKYLHDDLKADVQLARLAVRTNAHIFDSMSPELRNDRENLKTEIARNFRMCRYVSRCTSHQDDDELFVIAAKGYVEYRKKCVEHHEPLLTPGDYVKRHFSERIRSYAESIADNTGGYLFEYQAAIKKCEENLRIAKEKRDLGTKLPVSAKPTVKRSMKI